VDYSLDGEASEDSWACVVQSGKFVEVGRSHHLPGDDVRLEHMKTNRAHFSANVATLSEYRPKETGQIMNQVMLLFKDEKLQPITPLKTMGLADIPTCKGRCASPHGPSGKSRTISLPHLLTVQQDSVLDNLTPEDFAINFRSNVELTRILAELKGLDLEFFVIFSTSMSMLGTKKHRSYAAGNALQVALSTSHENLTTKCITLGLSGMIVSTLICQSGDSEKGLAAQGLVPMTNADLDTFLEYALTQPKEYLGHHIISGLDRESLKGSENHDAPDRPLFSHLPRYDTADSEKVANSSSTIAAKSITDAKSQEEAHMVVKIALQ